MGEGNNNAVNCSTKQENREKSKLVQKSDMKKRATMERVREVDRRGKAVLAVNEIERNAQ